MLSKIDRLAVRAAGGRYLRGGAALLPTNGGACLLEERAADAGQAGCVVSVISGEAEIFEAEVTEA